MAFLLPFLGNWTGWVFTEMGRQPWVVFGLQKTALGVSPSVGAGSVATSLVAFTLVYGLLAAVDGYLVLRVVRLGPPRGAGEAEEEADVDPDLLMSF